MKKFVSWEKNIRKLYFSCSLKKKNISDLKDEVMLLTSKLNNMTKFIRMLNKGSDVLDEVLQVGKVAGDLRGICFKYPSLDKQGESSMTNFILPKREPGPVMSNHMTQHRSRHQNTQTIGKLLRWRCNY